MTTVETKQIVELVQRVQNWPPPMRLALARRILETLEGPPIEQQPAERPRGPTAAEIAAQFKSVRPAPDDATVKQWIDDYRMQKYGK